MEKNRNFFIIFIFGLFFATISFAAGSATLSWTAGAEPDLAGYKIYYGTSPRNSDCPPGGYSNAIDVGKTATPENPSFKIENLKEGRTYYFSLTSYDIYGNESCFSSEVKKTIPLTFFSWLDSIRENFGIVLGPFLNLLSFLK